MLALEVWCPLGCAVTQGPSYWVADCGPSPSTAPACSHLHHSADTAGLVALRCNWQLQHHQRQQSRRPQLYSARELLPPVPLLSVLQIFSRGKSYALSPPSLLINSMDLQ